MLYQTFDVYVSAQTGTRHPYASENLALVINAISNVPMDYRPRIDFVAEGVGHWHGKSEPVVILTITTLWTNAVDFARYLARILSQDFVMIVSREVFPSAIQGVRDERIDTRTADSYTVRNGMGQRPYAYRVTRGRATDDGTIEWETPTHFYDFISRRFID